MQFGGGDVVSGMGANVAANDGSHPELKVISSTAASPSFPVPLVIATAIWKFLVLEVSSDSKFQPDPWSSARNL